MSINIDERSKNIATGVNIERDRNELRQSAIEALSKSTASAHARDDALSSREFEQLVNASYLIDKERIELECRTLLFLVSECGRAKLPISLMSG